jgi:hypothetical protein
MGLSFEDASFLAWPTLEEFNSIPGDISPKVEIKTRIDQQVPGMEDSYYLIPSYIIRFEPAAGRDLNVKAVYNTYYIIKKGSNSVPELLEIFRDSWERLLSDLNEKLMKYQLSVITLGGFPRQMAEGYINAVVLKQLEELDLL